MISHLQGRFKLKGTKVLLEGGMKKENESFLRILALA